MMNIFRTIGKKRSTSRLKMIQEVEEQLIEDRKEMHQVKNKTNIELIGGLTTDSLAFLRQ